MASYTRGDEAAWRALAQAAQDPNTPPDALLSRVKATAGRAIPCERRRDHSAFVALQALARASAEGPATRRRRLAPCLEDLARDCAEAAGWRLGPTEPVPAEGRSFAAARDLFDGLAAA